MSISLQPSQNIAIVGSGISGLSAAWLLSQNHDVTIYEANNYLGGHSHTVDIDIEGKSIPVDTGFIVYNAANYPNLTALFEHLDVPTLATDMSFSASINNGKFEYAGGNDGGIFAQKSNIFRPRFWRMLRDLLRFYKDSPGFLTDPSVDDLTLGGLLDRGGYSKAFVQDHLGPMGAAIWSSDAGEILDYPAKSFLKFFKNHGLLERGNAPQWRTVKGGSREYVTRLTASFKNHVRLSTPVQRITSIQGGVEIQSAAGTETFDHVILACHADQALALQPGIPWGQKSIFENLPYRENRIVLHSDPALMPKRRKAWASWNYIANNRDDKSPAVSYWMNRLQHLPADIPIIATLNPNREIGLGHIFGEFSYAHPVFNFAAQKAKQAIWDFQGENNIWYCGAYLGDGFHEDGIQSGLAVAEMLGGQARPWSKPDMNARIGLPDVLIPEMAIAAE